MRFWAWFAVLLLSQNAASETLSVQEIPIDSSEPYVFASTMVEDDERYLIVLDGLRVLMHSPEEPRALSLDLPKNTTAVDFFDIDEDGRREILVVAGDHILVHDLPQETSGSAWEVLFQHPSLLDRSTLEPFPHVLATYYEDQIALALPTRDGLELLDREGMAIATLPFELAGSGDIAFETLDNATAGVGVSIQAHGGQASTMRSTRQSASITAPMRFNVSALVSDRDLHSNLMSSREEFEFPLRADSERYRVFVVAQRAPVHHSMIRIVEAEPTDGSQSIPPATSLSVRRYPGFTTEPFPEAPDLNGDAYNDVLMWNVPRRPLTLSGALTAGRARVSSMRLTAHLYRPERGIYSGEPNAVLEVPIAGDRGARMLTRLLVTDVNRDGSSEIGLTSGPDSFSLWDFEPGSGFISRFEITLEHASPMDYRFIDGGDTYEPILVFRSDSVLEYCRIPTN